MTLLSMMTTLYVDDDDYGDFDPGHDFEYDDLRYR